MAYHMDVPRRVIFAELQAEGCEVGFRYFTKWLAANRAAAPTPDQLATQVVSFPAAPTNDVVETDLPDLIADAPVETAETDGPMTEEEFVRRLRALSAAKLAAAAAATQGGAVT